LEWQSLAAPGHADPTLVFYNAQHRILISADALWEHGFGFVPPRAWDAGALTRTRQTLDLIATLDVDVVIPGHGAPFRDVRSALTRAYSRLAALEQSDERIARQIAKVMFIYAVLARGGLPYDDVVNYAARVGCLRDLNDQFLRLSREAFATWLVDDSLASGTIVRSGSDLVAAR
jgi:glyoxylase-like metal-dependent hydrolase (beta-lactamase superfamily II)